MKNILIINSYNQLRYSISIIYPSYRKIETIENVWDSPDENAIDVAIDLNKKGEQIDYAVVFVDGRLFAVHDIEEVMKVKIKPKECPFCGCEHINIASLGDCWRALCVRCNASMRKKEQTDLIMAWNMREKDGNS